jgi:hypothetical protein
VTVNVTATAPSRGSSNSGAKQPALRSIAKASQEKFALVMAFMKAHLLNHGKRVLGQRLLISRIRREAR